MIKSIANLFSAAFGKSAGERPIFHPSQTCPECGTPLMRDSRANTSPEIETEGWRCPNLDCPAQIRARIEHWCSPAAMDIPGADAALLAKWVGQGLVRDPAELYRLKLAEIAALEGMDADSARKIFDAITASQKREAWRLFFGLSIPLVTAEQAQSLCRHFKSVDNVFAAGAERLVQADGIGEATARSVAQWHSDGINRKLVKRLFKAGLNFKA